MLPSASRLKRKSDFGRVYAKGRSYSTDLIVMYVLPSNRGAGRIGFSVSKKLGGAVKRNRTKRILREAARQLLPEIRDGYDVVVVARRKAAEAGLAQSRAALGELLLRSGILDARD